MIGSLSSELIGGLSNGMIYKTKIFCFEKTIFIHGICMCEGVGEDSRHGAWHIDIHVEICMFLLECVNMELHVHLGRE